MTAHDTVVDPSTQFEPYRRELTGYCYRMLGSASESEDAVQDTMIRAWRAFHRFEGRSSVRSWLYRIATNVCLDMLGGKQRRARPMDLSEQGSVDTPLNARAEVTWIGPVPDASVLTEDPAQAAVNRESIKLAFIAMLQHLPPRQRAVLIMREVLCWKAEEVAALLETTVASVNSALQRARATLGSDHIDLTNPSDPTDERDQALLAGYMDAFERYDMDSMRALLRDDAIMSMPPYDLWLQGPAEIEKWFVGHGIGCQGSRLVPVDANAMAGFGQYRRGPDGSLTPWALQVIEVTDGKVSGINSFLDTAALFPLFGLPDHLDA